MTAYRSLLRGLGLWSGGAALAAMIGLSAMAETNDYPTAARVDYVLGCMAANGQSYLAMQKCSCSIDVIASMIPYQEYERVETILRMREGQGELSVLFRASRDLEARVQEFRQAQVQADLRCF